VAAGIEAPNRQLVDQLARSANGPFTVSQAAQMLGLPEARSLRLLRYLQARGWLSRVKRGLYITVPIGATNPSDWREDPWIVAVTAFGPCYIAGWSACEHWSLTEQLFRTILVVTARTFRAAEIEVQGTPFRLRHRPVEMHFGTRTVWRGKTRVPVSDPTRAIVDVLAEPTMGGGIRHIGEMLVTYFSGEHRDDKLIVQYGDKLGNRTVFKRLGHLVEALGITAPEVVTACRERVSTGITALDPSVSTKGTIHKRWNLRVNVLVGDES
jgi:predicted transcriptional regulator of viral defense system